MSMVEICANYLVGYGFAWVITPPIMALYGYSVPMGKAFGITAFFTITSMLRSYVVRRGFNWIQRRRNIDV